MCAYGRSRVCVHGEMEGVYMEGVECACMGRVRACAYGRVDCECMGRGRVCAYGRGGVCVLGEREDVCI